MKTVLKTAPTNKPVTLREAKEHLRIVLGNTDEDDYLEALLDAAIERTEQFLRRRLITQTWYYYLDDWPGVDAIKLPYGKLQSVTSVKYTDSDGDQSTFSSANYIVDTNQDPGRVVLAYGETWPTATLYPSNPIEIEYVCGYGDDGSDVKAMIRHAIKLAISDLYENREPTFIGQGFTLTETKAFERCLWPYRLHEVFP